MGHFGLDISNLSIKVLEARNETNGFEILSFGEVRTPAPVRSNNPQDLDLIAKALSKLVKDAKISSKDVYISIPESQVFTRVIQLPAITEKELATAIKFESEQYIPVPLDEVYLEYEVLYSPPPGQSGAKMEVLLVAAERNIVEKMVQIAQMAGLTPLVEETSLLSSLRALRKQIREYALLVDIGNTSADIAILQNGQLKQTSSLATAGEALTRSIAQGLSLSVPQAEKYKHTYGLETNQLEGKIAKVMHTPINNIVEHINKNIRFVKTLSSEARIDQIVLSGGTALLPNLSYYIVNQLNIEVDLANPLQECLNKNLPGQLISNAPRFCSVIGLALRD